MYSFNGGVKTILLLSISIQCLRVYQSSQLHQQIQSKCKLNYHWNQLNKTCIICPTLTPIFFKGKCQACPIDTIYRPQLSQCIKCPNIHMFYDNNTKKCVCTDKKEYFDGHQCRKVCLPLQIWNSQKLICEYCSKQMPVYHNGICLICPNGTFYQNSTNLCITCPLTMKYDYETHQCICFDPQNSFVNHSRCYCLPGMIWQQKQKICQQCPKSTPVSKNNLCLVCPPSSQYLPNLNQCFYCPKTMHYNSIIGKCICQQNYFLNRSVCVKCSKNQIWKFVEKKCEKCVPQTPLVRDNQCVKCPEHTYYNSYNNQCVKCPINFLWNQTKQQCDCSYHKLIVNGTVKCIKCANNQVWDSKKSECNSCPTQYPLVINGICNKCPQHSFYNSTSQLCFRCLSNLTYNKQLKQCICPKQIPFFNGVTCETSK